MATITLNAYKINQMPDLIRNVKNQVTDYNSELSMLQSKTLTINKNICELEDIIISIQASSKTQEEKIDSLEDFYQSSEKFISDVVVIDNNAADVVNQRKEDFYEEYYYLKPECEKNGWEKFCDNCKSICEWCKEHWIMVLTVVVVVLIAAAAVVCGVAIAFIAAIAGIVALAVCVADVICMLVTGGKDIATILREKGLHILADIFQGLSFGADLVSIVFPIGAAIKTMVKMGVKTFAKVTIKTAQKAFKEMIEKVFKSGFKNGVKNLGEIAFKTLILDIDDLKNWKAVTLKMQSPTKNWIIDGDKLVPSSTIVPRKNNPNGLTMDEIMRQEKFNMFPNEIPYRNKYPDMSVFSVQSVPIDMKNMDFGKYTEAVLNGEISNDKFKSILRNNNFTQADNNLGVSKKSLEKQLGYKLTWHEDLNMKLCHLVPTEIHANVGHTGGIGNYRFIFNQIPNISNLVSEKLTQWGIRLGFNISVGIAMSQ